MRSLYIETTVYVLLCISIYLFEPKTSHWLAYYHSDISQFELWRLITATFCHTNFNHLAMNLLGLLVTIGLFFESFKIMTLTMLIIFSSVIIGLSLFFLEPSLIGYVGLSGVLHALFSFGIACDIQRKTAWGYLLAVGLLLKLAHEQFFGATQSTMELIDAPVMVNAHLYGAVAGLLFFALLNAINRKR
ncbi:rhombosortase [Psychromonas sp. psych-6C06]|uniref:rhombosortase n=1 Tax=Psychromonas sp. psych-6C06 TaxID=2058089 RepID=UPI000C34F118|nr:rhombosortase [Psychromonas sp. psych-6C06]PKF62757.1 rhombosortase [Psychromonas sp. psych-6C06]